MLTHDTIILAATSAEMRSSLRSILSQSYNILEASTAEQLIILLEENYTSVATVIFDVDMTTSDGQNALAAFTVGGLASHIPVMAVTTEEDHHRAEHFALENGATEVLYYPLHAAMVSRRVENVIALFYNKRTLEKVIKTQAAAIHDSYEKMVDTLSSIIEYRNAESGDHVLRIRRLTRMLLEELTVACPEYGITKDMISAITSAAALHDIGKISIPDNILNKPGRLTPEEFEVMKTHTTTGGEILKNFVSIGNGDYLRYAYNICLYHHERFDGSGYPEGLKGDDIPICAQVVGLADAYDALTTDRVYKKAIPYLEASNMIINGECGVFSPKLLECFKHIRGSFEELARSYSNGRDPDADNITVPLPPPKKSDAGSLEEATVKYRALLHHTNASVLEIDFDQGLFHLVYDPMLTFSAFAHVATFQEAMTRLAEESIHPDDRHFVTSDLDGYLADFFSQGLRKSSRSYRVKGRDGVYRRYNASTLRISTDGSDARKAIIVWLPAEDGRASEEVPLPTEVIRLTCRYDRSLSFVDGGNELLSLLGYDSGSHCVKGLLDLISSSLPSATEDLAEQLSRSSLFEAILPLSGKNALRYVFYRGQLRIGEDGTEQLNGIAVDCSFSYSRVKKRIDSISAYRTIIEDTEDILFEWDVASDVLTFSDNWKEHFDYDHIHTEASYNLRTRSHFHPDDLHIFFEKVSEVRSTDVRFVELTARIANNSGKYIWNRIRMTAQRNTEGEVINIIGIISDIDAEKKLSLEFAERADQDALTKLLNKEAGRRRISEVLSSADELKGAFFIIDLDNFKLVNDRYGHLLGDALLANVADTIRGMFRERDIIVRIGGDEFLAFSPNISDRNTVAKRCDSLIRSISQMYTGQLGDIDLSCSIGVSMLPDHGTDYSELFRKADVALYQAKENGKNGYHIYDSDLIQPRYSTVSRRIDSEQILGIAGGGLTEYVFQRLYDTNDIEGTVNSVMELIGRQLNVSRVYVFENNDDNTTCSNTFEWCNDGVEPEIDNLQDISYADLPGFIESFDERGLLYCTDINELNDSIRAIVEPQGIRAMLHCAIREKGVFRGYVGLDDCKAPRLWMKEQIELVSLLSQIVSIFILKERAQRHSEELFEDMKRILDEQYSYVYIVETGTYRLKFFNGSVSQLDSSVTIGTPCYKAFFGLDKPCENCPIKAGDGAQLTVNNPNYGVTVRASASSVRWNGRKEWLVTCTNVKE